MLATMLTFPSEIPEEVQEAPKPAKADKETMTEKDFMALLSGLEEEYDKAGSDSEEEQLLPPEHKPPKTVEKKTPPKQKKIPPKTNALKALEKKMAPKTNLVEKQLKRQHAVIEEPVKKKAKTEEEEPSVINMSVYFCQQVKQGSKPHKALMSMLQ